MSEPTTEELSKKATEALLLVAEFWMQLAMQVKRLEATDIESLEIRHQALLEIVKSGIREFQIIEDSAIHQIKAITGPKPEGGNK